MGQSVAAAPAEPFCWVCRGVLTLEYSCHSQTCRFLARLWGRWCRSQQVCSKASSGAPALSALWDKEMKKRGSQSKQSLMLIKLMALSVFFLPKKCGLDSVSNSVSASGLGNVKH